MADSRSVDYKVNVTVGRSIGNVRDLATALRALHQNVQQVSTTFSSSNIGEQMERVFPTRGASTAGIQGTTQAVDALTAAQTRASRATDSWAAGLRNLPKEMERVARMKVDTSGGWANMLNAHQSNTTADYVGRMQGLSAQYQQLSQGWGNASQNITNNLSQQATAQNRALSSMNAMVAGTQAVAAAFASWRVTTFIGHFALLAARVENLDTVMKAIGQTNHITAGQMDLTETGMRKLGITTQVSREIIARFTQNNLDLADSLKVARIAQDAAVVAGLNSSETAERMMVAVQRLDTRMLRNIGILINLRSEYQKVAIATGRYENSLTANEKQQIVMQAVMRAGAALNGTYEKSLQDVYKQWTSLDRKTEEAQRNIGGGFIPLFKILVNVLDSLATAISNDNYGLQQLIVMFGSGLAAITFAAAIVSVGRAFMYLYTVLTAMAGGSVIGGIAVWFIAIAAAIGIAVGGISNFIHHYEALQKQIQTTAEQQAYEKLRVMELADEIERLGQIQNKTEEQELDLLNAKNEALTLFNTTNDENIKKIEEATKKQLQQARTTEEFVRILRDAQKLGVSIRTSPDEVLEQKKARIAELQRDANKSVSIGDVLTGKESFFSNAHNDWEEIKKTKIEMEALQHAVDQMSLKKFDVLEQKMENLHRTVLQTKKAMQEATVSKMGDDAQDIMKRVDALFELAAATSTVATIQKQFEVQERENARNAAKDIEEIKKNAKDPEGKEDETKQKITERNMALDVQQATLRQKTKNQLEEYKELTDEVTNSQKENAQSLENMAQAHAKAAFIEKYASKEMGEYAGKVYDLYTAYGKYNKEVASFNDILADKAKKIADLKKQIDSGDPFANDGGVDAAKKRLAGMQEAYKTLQDMSAQNFEKFKDDLTSTITAIEEAAGAGGKAIREMKDATEKLRMESELYGQGLDSGVISAIMKAHDETVKQARDTEKLIQAYADASLNLKEWQKAAADNPASKPIAAMVAEYEKLKAHFAEALKDMDALSLAEEEKTQAELTEMRTKAIEERAQKEKEVVERTYKTLGDIKRSAESKIDSDTKDIDRLTNEGIDKERSANEKIFKRDIQFRKLQGDPGADLEEKAFDFSKDLLSNMQGAANPAQINKILSQFDQGVDLARKLHGGANGKFNNNIEQGLVDARKELIAAGKEAQGKEDARQKEIDDKKADRILQGQHKDAAVAAAETLTRIEMILRMNGGNGAGVKQFEQAGAPGIAQAAGLPFMLGGIGGAGFGLGASAVGQGIVAGLMDQAKIAAAASKGMADEADKSADALEKGFGDIAKFSTAATDALARQRKASEAASKTLHQKIQSQGLK